MSDWERKGWIRIHRNPQYAGDDDICMEFLTWIGGEALPTNWIRDRPKIDKTKEANKSIQRIRASHTTRRINTGPLDPLL